MTPEPCPECNGKCCIDQDYRCRVLHMAAEFYEHVCELCVDGDKYVPPRTYEDGIAEGECRATAAVVAWLRGQQEAAEWALTAAGYEHAADAIERGEHRREEER